ncbi:MAG: prephenate dehydrogenase/arogenate dehydrogenase family protein [Candidatus Omnitrophica bacterium]|nr:prephenate dehydrogenase/arogenate dehydrogenase family protein [Candidatus Omnitrophota bacterium]
MARFNRVTIIGLGLIGGSLGLAIRRRRLAKVIVGYSRKPATLRAASRRGAIDLGTTDLRAAVRHADFVVLATPVDTIVPLARRVACQVRPGTILTDVGSTKGRIVRSLERSLPCHVSFVGAHPLAGSEQRGMGAASKELFRGSVCILTKTPRTNVQALRAVQCLWKPLVGRVIVMSPARHDRLLAAMSHLPHLLAYTLVGILPREGRLAVPPSFAQMTRIAKSDPGLWNAIFFSNRAELLRSIDGFDRHWRLLRRLLTGARQSALRRALSRAKNTRDALQDA